MDKLTSKDDDQEVSQELPNGSQPLTTTTPTPLPTVLELDASPSSSTSCSSIRHPHDEQQPPPKPPPQPQPSKAAPPALLPLPPLPSLSSSTPSPPPPPSPPPLPPPPPLPAPPPPQRRPSDQSQPATPTTAATSTASVLATATTTTPVAPIWHHRKSVLTPSFTQRKTPLTPSFTQRKKMQRVSSEEQRWRRTDLNLIQYMSRLKEQYMMRQTEHDLQLRRQKVPQDSFESDTTAYKDDCVPPTKLTIEPIDSVQGQGESACEDVKTPKSACVRATQRQHGKCSRSLIPVRSPSRSPPLDTRTASQDRTAALLKSLHDNEYKEHLPVAAKLEDKRNAKLKSTKPSLLHRPVREAVVTRNAAKFIKPRSASARADVIASSPVRPSKTGLSPQQTRAGQRRASSQVLGKVQPAHSSRPVGVDNSSRTRSRRVVDTRMTGESGRSSEPWLRTSSEAPPTPTQPLELITEMRLELSSKESSPVSCTLADHPPAAKLGSKSSLKAWPEDRREQKMVALRNTFSMVKRGPPPVPPVHVFHTEERANRRNRKTRFSLDYYRRSRHRAESEWAPEASPANRQDKPAKERSGSRVSSPVVSQDKDGQQKVQVTAKTEAGISKALAGEQDHVTILTPSRLKEVARSGKLETSKADPTQGCLPSSRKKRSTLGLRKKSPAGGRTGCGQALPQKSPPDTKLSSASPSRKPRKSKGRRRNETPTPAHKTRSNKKSARNRSKPALISEHSQPGQLTADPCDSDHVSDLHKSFSAAADSADQSPTSKSPHKKVQSWTVEFQLEEKSKPGPCRSAHKLPTTGIPRKHDSPKTRKPTHRVKKKHLSARKAAPTTTSHQLKQKEPRRSQSTELKSFSPSSSPFSATSASGTSYALYPSSEAQSGEATSQLSPIHSRKSVTSPSRLPSRRQRVATSRSVKTRAAKAVQVGRRSPSLLPVYKSRLPVYSNSPSPVARLTRAPRLDTGQAEHKTPSRDVGVQSGWDQTWMSSPGEQGSPSVSECQQPQLTGSPKESIDDSLKGLNLLNDVHEPPSDKSSDDWTMRKEWKRSKQEQVAICWNRSESDVKIRKHTHSDRAQDGLSQQQLTINLCGRSSEEDRQEDEDSLPAVVKLDRQAKQEPSKQPGQTASSVPSDSQSKVESSREYDWSVIDVEESPPTAAGTNQKMPLLDAATSEKIEAELEEALTQLYKNQYQLSLRVVLVKDDIRRLKENLDHLQPAKAPAKPLDPERWEGTLLDYLMLLAFMVVQIVVQFVLVKM